MATLILNHLSIQPHCPVFYRNGIKQVPRQKFTVMNGYVPDGYDIVQLQRDGYMREIKDVLLLHFREKPDDGDPWHIKYWNHHTTPEELFEFFGYTLTPGMRDHIIIDGIDPWIGFTEDNDLFLYFGEDKPIRKTKTSKNLTPHAKIWGRHSKWFKEGREPVEYEYWDVKDKSKLLFCGESTINRVFPEFDWANIDPYGKCIRRIDIGVFRASDPYDYSDEEKAEILRKKAEDEERKRKYQEELEKRKHTPGYCECCGEEGASYVEDPYDADINGVSNYRWLCGRCYENIAGDI